MEIDFIEQDRVEVTESDGGTFQGVATMIERRVVEDEEQIHSIYVLRDGGNSFIELGPDPDDGGFDYIKKEQ